MKDTLSRKYNAAKAGLSVMHENDSIWSGLTSIASKVSAADDLLEQIEDIEMTTMGSGTAQSEGKMAKKRIAAKLAFGIARPLRTFAEDTGNDELFGETSFSRTELLFVKDVHATERWKMIKNRANEHIAALTTGQYPVTPADINALDDAITAFTQVAGAPKIKRAANKTAHGNLDQGFKDLGKLTKQIQDLLVPFALSEANFYSQVIDAFDVDETGKRHWAIRIICTDKDSGVRLKNVLAAIKDTSLSKKSSSQGVIIFKSAELENGSYTLVLGMNGYVSQTVSKVKVEAGKLTRVEVVLEQGN